MRLTKSWQRKKYKGKAALAHLKTISIIGLLPARRMVIALLAIIVSLVTSLSAPAQSNNVPIVRDAEIEELMGDYAEPLLRAAGVKRSRTDIVLVNSRQFNAFVSGRKIFINLGAIVQAETPNEIIGVLAHEIGHLAGGHQDRLRQQLDRAQTIATVTSALGIAAAIAAGASGSGTGVQAGAGAAAGGIEAARRGLLSYQRTEELAADRAAVDYLNATKQSTKGMLTTFERFDDDIALVRGRIDPYRVSHPLPRERIAALQTLARESPYFNKTDPSSLQVRHDKARAKILAYTYGPNAVEGALAKRGNSTALQYGRAITTFLYKNPKNAVPQIDALIRSAPKNPYYHEIKGEIFLRARDAKGAVNAFSKAVQLDSGKSASILVALGHALVLAGGEANLRRAVGELEVAASIDPNNPRAYRHLAMAYGRLKDTGSANLATAEEKFYSGQYNAAKQFAARAKRSFKRTDPQWLRADDIMRFQVPKNR